MVNIIKKIWTKSIRRQLMLGIALVHAVLMTIFVFDLVARQRSFLHEQSDNTTLSLSRTLASNSVSWVLANDVIGIEEVVDSESFGLNLRPVSYVVRCAGAFKAPAPAP